MKKFKSLALKRPFLFGIALVFVFALLGALTYPVHFLFPETEVGQLYGDSVSKLIIAMVFVVFLWRFGWLKASGMTNAGNLRVWLIVAPVAAYKIVAETYAFTSGIPFKTLDPQLVIANVAYHLPTSLVEETMCRALVLTAMMLAWGDTKRGQVKAVVLSSLFFGMAHLINVMVRPVGLVLFQTVILTLPGILYGALVLTHRTIWPAVVIHWLTNVAVNVRLISVGNYQETPARWITFAGSLIPVVAYSAYLMWKLPESYGYANQEGASEVCLTQVDTRPIRGSSVT